jgi:hypothetical protein
MIGKKPTEKEMTITPDPNLESTVDEILKKLLAART